MQRALPSANAETIMFDTLQGISLLAIAEILGPIALALALIYGIYHSSRRRAARPAAQNRAMGLWMGVAAVVVLALGVLIFANTNSNYTSRSDQQTHVTTSPQTNPRDTR